MAYARIRSLLFRLDPERVHKNTLQLLRFSGGFGPARRILSAAMQAPDQPVNAFGLQFKNPVGLAAGYDKDGLAWRGLASLGFSHIEVGTVTPRPQPGNPKPRVFRLQEDKAVINRLGFPGLGADFAARQLQGKRPARLVLGVNIGKNKDTPNESAAEDYLSLLARFAPLADYLTINVSSPNTVGLRRLQARSALEALLTEISHARKKHRAVPILVKLAPDLKDEELADSVGAIVDAGMDGIIATNTTIRREGLRSQHAVETGGLSGAPLTALSTAIITKIIKLVDGAVPVVAVGGIMSGQDAREKLDAGAALVQVYTGMIYSGPGLVKEIMLGLEANPS
jgi:dihydroorotate dehydrogenase